MKRYCNIGVTASKGAPVGCPPLSGNAVIKATDDFAWLTVNPENDESINHGDFVPWGYVDDLCIQDVTDTLRDPLWFGDGIRCCGQNVVRIGTDLPAGNATDTATDNQIGGAGPPISEHPGNSNLSCGDTCCYQRWYRDPGPPNPSQAQFFNLSNALVVLWGA